MPEARPKPQSMIIGVIISGIIVGGILGLLIRRRSIRRSSSSRNHGYKSDIEARRLSGPPAHAPASGSCGDNCPAQRGSGRMARLPSFDSTHTPLTSSTHPSSASRHAGNTSPSTFHGALPTAFGRTQTDEPHLPSGHSLSESDALSDGASFRKRLVARKQRHRRTKYGGQSLDAKMAPQPTSLAAQATLVALPRASVESIERRDTGRPGQEWPSAFMMHELGSSSTGSLPLDVLPRKAAPGWGSPDGGEGRRRVTAASIVETTEKAPPARVLRNKLLSLISSPSRPATALDAGSEQKKHYWEILHVHADDSWWQLPFPPPLSPITHSFQLPDPLPTHSSPPAPAHHHPQTNQQPPTPTSDPHPLPPKTLQSEPFV